MGETLYIPHLQIRSHSAICYTIPTERPSHARHDLRGHKTYSGEITAHAQKRIRRAVEILLMKSPPKIIFNTVSGRPNNFRLSFVTVTISQAEPVPHREAYEKGLKPLLRWLREKQGWKDYIWKAELQARGQVHWHITGNQFLDFRLLKSAWNNIQYQRGWLNDFYAKQGHWAPNSIDIHAVQKVARLDLYLAKYISKSGEKLGSKCWDCSDSLRGKKFFAFEICPETGQRLDNAVETGRARKIVLEQCSIYETAVPQQFIPNSKREEFASWLSSRHSAKGAS